MLKRRSACNVYLCCVPKAGPGQPIRLGRSRTTDAKARDERHPRAFRNSGQHDIDSNLTSLHKALFIVLSDRITLSERRPRRTRYITFRGSTNSYSSSPFRVQYGREAWRDTPDTRHCRCARCRKHWSNDRSRFISLERPRIALCSLGLL